MGRTPEQQAADFMRANDASPVVAGRGLPKGGGVYRLDDGTSHRLGLAACRLLPSQYPRWMSFGDRA